MRWLGEARTWADWTSRRQAARRATGAVPGRRRSYLEIAFQPDEEHFLLPLFVIEEQLVFVIDAGIDCGFADDVPDAGTKGRQCLIDAIASAQRYARVGIQREAMS